MGRGLARWAGTAVVLASAIGLLYPAAGMPESGAPERRTVIDTDAGSDDLIAIAFLLARPDVHIEAITIANGLAHVRPGAANVLRLLELAGGKDIPVYVGRETPLRGAAEFPAEWRMLSDNLPGVDLPPAARKPEAESAADYLVRRLANRRRPARILALGPLTNLAEALDRDSKSALGIEEIVIMGGAMGVPGNLGDGGYFKTDNRTAEWNLFVDPLAAERVFASGARITLVPLDATNKVPISLDFLGELEAQARTPLARFVAQVLETDRKFIEQNFYFAWDPLAAVALVERAVVSTRPAAIEVRQKPPEEGRTVEASQGRRNVRVAYDADAAAFKRIFLRAFLP